MTNSISLRACAPTPLASYLKALGILRLVSEQRDKTARGYWKNESFILETALTKDDIAKFFLEEYSPTPLIDPWNNDSGFRKEGEAAKILKKFEETKSPRLDYYRIGIKSAREIYTNANIANKSKEKLISECRQKWRGRHLEWLETAVILDNKLEAKYPSLLGTGGNDGRLDFTANFRQRFCDLFDIETPKISPRENTAALLEHALYGTAVTGTGDYSIGQYAPGNAGGANSSSGAKALDGKSNVNPWDFILFMEGTVLFAAAASRRLGSTGVSSASAPFAIRAEAIGHSSVSAKEKSARGEQWFPLWERPATLREIRALLSEGRAQLGRSTAAKPVDMARAIARLGITRGINAFERYGYIERNGQANFAVPLGRWKVVTQPHQDLLSDLDKFLDNISKDAAGERATASLCTVARRLNDAVLNAAANGSMPRSWQAILFALSDADALAASLPPDPQKVRIAPRLRPAWISAADDGSAEFRLALAFASQKNVRQYFLPILGNKLDSKGKVSVVCYGRDFISDAIAFVERRIIESAKKESRSIGQFAKYFASLSDISAFLQGALYTTKILSLSRALMTINYDADPEKNPPIQIPEKEQFTDDAFSLFRFCIAPSHWDTKIPIRADIFRRLASGDIVSASRHAAQHLRAHGKKPPLELAVGDARIIAAALAFPLSTKTRDVLAKSLISFNNNQHN